jgi:hypothetical protein
MESKSLEVECRKKDTLYNSQLVSFMSQLCRRMGFFGLFRTSTAKWCYNRHQTGKTAPPLKPCKIE